MAFYPGGVKTSILSWSQMVREADPNYTRLSLQPWVYEFSNGRLFVDPLPLYDYSFISAGLVNNGGILALDGNQGWPTSTFELDGGDLWSNGGEPTIFPGFGLNVGPPLFFGQISAQSLLATSGRTLPWTPPPPGSEQLWNPYGSVGGPVFVA